MEREEKVKLLYDYQVWKDGYFPVDLTNHAKVNMEYNMKEIEKFLMLLDFIKEQNEKDPNDGNSGTCMAEG